MNCPHCNSEQTTSYEVRCGLLYLECVNCDKEGTIHLEMTPSEALSSERGRMRGRKGATLGADGVGRCSDDQEAQGSASVTESTSLEVYAWPNLIWRPHHHKPHTSL